MQWQSSNKIQNNTKYWECCEGIFLPYIFTKIIEQISVILYTNYKINDINLHNIVTVSQSRSLAYAAAWFFVDEEPFCAGNIYIIMKISTFQNINAI